MKEIRQTNRTYNSGIEVNDLKGRKVLDMNGKNIGKVIEIRIDPQSLNLDGIEIDRGFFGTDTFIGRKYIASLSKEGIVLNMTPASDYEGMHVLDSSGRDFGRVKEIRTKGRTNNISAIVVGTGLLHNDVVFTKADVHSVGGNIMLNSIYDESAVKVGGRIK